MASGKWEESDLRRVLSDVVIDLGKLTYGGVVLEIVIRKAFPDSGMLVVGVIAAFGFVGIGLILRYIKRQRAG